MSTPRRRVIRLEVVEGYYHAFCDDGTHWVYFPAECVWSDEGPIPIPQPESDGGELSLEYTLEQIWKLLIAQENYGHGRK